MPFSLINCRWQWLSLTFPLAMLLVSGCSRTKYRINAEADAYAQIAETTIDPNCNATDYTIDMDPRSRYFESYDEDFSPMPPDDPISHQYMHVVAGRKGWKHWHDNGDRVELENPAWRDALYEYMETTPEGAVKLDVDSALTLAYVHSPAHQVQLETLFLSALDVTAERFQLETQFFGGYDARYAHNGSVIPPSLSFSPLLRRFVINPAIDGPGVENNRLTLGRPFGADPALQVSKRFATAGQLLVGFANSFVFEFTGGDANLSTSLANFSLVQPLLRGAGRDIALEQLTFSQRNLLANLRAYNQFRQGFYTGIAIGENGTPGTARDIRTTSLRPASANGSTFSPSGYLGLLQLLQEIRNAQDNLALQKRTLDRLDALLDVGVIDLLQVDQRRQRYFVSQSDLLGDKNRFEFALDRYKTDTLGLPPDLPVELADGLIERFQFFPKVLSDLQNDIVALQLRVGEFTPETSVETLQQELDRSLALAGVLSNQFDVIRDDIQRMNEVAPIREATMIGDELEQFREDREGLSIKLSEIEQECFALLTELEGLQAGAPNVNKAQKTRALAAWIAKFLRLAERLVLIPARARLEAVTIERINLKAPDAFQIALANRLDFMNGRANLVDSWRLIQVSADALQSVVDVTASGDIRTARNNPVSFRAPTGNLRMGLEFDAPFTRLLERNAYRETLVNYQRNRRNFIQSRDQLHLGLRSLIRQAELLKQNLEIRRSAVANAIRQNDLTQANLSAPVRPPLPGQRPAQFAGSTSFNLQESQSALLQSQNDFLQTWLQYYALKLRLVREMGIMTLDGEGRWIEYPLPGEDEYSEEGEEFEEVPLPPILPVEEIDFARYGNWPAIGTPEQLQNATVCLPDLPQAESGLPNHSMPQSLDTRRYSVSPASLVFPLEQAPRHDLGSGNLNRLPVIDPIQTATRPSGPIAPGGAILDPGTRRY